MQVRATERQKYAGPRARKPFHFPKPGRRHPIQGPILSGTGPNDAADAHGAWWAPGPDQSWKRSKQEDQASNHCRPSTPMLSQVRSVQQQTTQSPAR